MFGRRGRRESQSGSVKRRPIETLSDTEMENAVVSGLALRLQWGRPPKEAEGALAALLERYGFTLQWGRPPKEAEGSKSFVPLGHCLSASMGPPPEGGGRPAVVIAVATL